MLIIEGPDNAGKSMLVQQLIEMDPSLHVIHRDRFDPKRGETIGDSYVRALIPESGDRVRHGSGVMDRLLASEEIYGDLFRGGSRVTASERLAVLSLLDSYGTVVVHCDPNDGKIIEGWSEREQLYEDHPLKIAHAYRERIHGIFDRRIIRYDWSSPSASIQRTQILDLHARIRDYMRGWLEWWSALPYGIGHLQPDVVFVGEKLNHDSRVPFQNGPAAAFFARTLDEVAGFDPRRTYITNAIKGTERDAAILRAELNFLAHAKIRVVLLGREAERMYDYVRTSLNYPHRVRAVPHPQYWRRFHWKRSDEYAHLITEALEAMR